MKKYRNKIFLFSLLILGVFSFGFMGNGGNEVRSNTIAHAQGMPIICPASGYVNVVDMEGGAAYSQTLGHIKASHHSADNFVKIYSDGNFSGFVYSQTAGWVSMQGVKVNCETGTLFGNAYSQTTGNIAFSLPQKYQNKQPEINPLSRNFQGYAYGETSGWIRLEGWKVDTPKFITGILVAKPDKGNPDPTFNSELTAKRTGGDVSGEISYQFDCDTDDNISFSPEQKINTYACTYSSGVTAKARIIQGGAIVEPEVEIETCGVSCVEQECGENECDITKLGQCWDTCGEAPSLVDCSSHGLSCSNDCPKCSKRGNSNWIETHL